MKKKKGHWVEVISELDLFLKETHGKPEKIENYKKELKKLSKSTLQKFKKVVDTIQEQVELEQWKHDIGCCVENRKFEQDGLLMSDVFDIRESLVKEYKVLFYLPNELDEPGEPGEKKESISFYSPYTLEPYATNFINFRKIINSLLKTDLKNNPEKNKQREEKKDEQKKKKQSKKILCLNLAGDLYKDSNKKHNYQMRAKSNRYRIIKYLAERPDYQETSALTSGLDVDNEKTIRTEIGKIKVNVKKYLKINDLIESRWGAGYRINPKFKIIMKKQG